MNAIHNHHHNHRGTAYIVVLATSMIITVVGLSAMVAGRVQHRVAGSTRDFAEARLYAMSAVDLGFLLIEQNPPDTNWRNLLGNNGGFPIQDRTIGRGRLTLQAQDPLDGDLNNGPDPVFLTGIGELGDTRYKLQVQLDGSGSPVPGTWQRVVD